MERRCDRRLVVVVGVSRDAGQEPDVDRNPVVQVRIGARLASERERVPKPLAVGKDAVPVRKLDDVFSSPIQRLANPAPVGSSPPAVVRERQVRELAYRHRQNELAIATSHGPSRSVASKMYLIASTSFTRRSSRFSGLSVGIASSASASSSSVPVECLTCKPHFEL